MIRKAVESDIETIVSLGVEFGKKSQFVHTMEVNEDKIREAIHFALSNPSVVLLVHEINKRVEGVVYGMELQPFFSNEVVLQELALYSKRQTGIIHLIEAFENEAKIRGIRKVVVGSKPAFCNLKNIYERRGFIILEEQYLKVGE
jgi:N-acetylglutamate synthase-like GNAT family acetyltransferase